MDMIERDVSAQLDAQEKLMQAKVDQATAIARTLENGQKEVDWWLTWIGVFFTVIGFIVGVVLAVIPYLATRSQRKDIERDLEESKKYLAEIKRIHSDANRFMNNLPQPDMPQREQDAIQRRLAKEAKSSPLAKLAEKAMALAKVEDWEASAGRWEAITDAQPDNIPAWMNLGYAKAKAGQRSQDRQAVLFKAAADAYAESVRLDPDNPKANYNLANALTDWARQLTEAERPAKFAEAAEKYAEAVRLDPKKDNAWNNWALLLFDWAQDLPEQERPAKYTEAIAKFEEALRLKPDKENAWAAWGLTLLKWAQVLPREEQPDKLAEASDKYAKAVRLNPEHDKTWELWGLTLLTWARLLDGPERLLKYSEAVEKFAKAIQFGPDGHDALSKFGNTLFEWARLLQQPEQQEKLSQAWEALLKAEKLKPGSSAYNLACIAAMSGRLDEAKIWVEKVLASNSDLLHYCGLLRTDKDLDNLRDLAWFRDLVDSNCSGLTS